MKRRLVNIKILEEEVKKGSKILVCKSLSRVKKKKRTVNAMSLLKKCNSEQRKQLLDSIGDS